MLQILTNYAVYTSEQKPGSIYYSKLPDFSRTCEIELDTECLPLANVLAFEYQGSLYMQILAADDSQLDQPPESSQPLQQNPSADQPTKSFQISVLRQPGELISTRPFPQLNAVKTPVIASACQIYSSQSVTSKESKPLTSKPNYLLTVYLTCEGVFFSRLNLATNKFHQDTVGASKFFHPLLNWDLPLTITSGSTLAATPELDYKNDPVFQFKSEEIVFLFSLEGDNGTANKQLIPHSLDYQMVNSWWVPADSDTISAGKTNNNSNMQRICLHKDGHLYKVMKTSDTSNKESPGYTTKMVLKCQPEWRSFQDLCSVDQQAMGVVFVVTQSSSSQQSNNGGGIILMCDREDWRIYQKINDFGGVFGSRVWPWSSGLVLQCAVNGLYVAQGTSGLQQFKRLALCQEFMSRPDFVKTQITKFDPMQQDTTTNNDKTSGLKVKVYCKYGVLQIESKNIIGLPGSSSSVQIGFEPDTQPIGCHLISEVSKLFIVGAQKGVQVVNLKTACVETSYQLPQNYQALSSCMSVYSFITSKGGQQNSKYQKEYQTSLPSQSQVQYVLHILTDSHLVQIIPANSTDSKSQQIAIPMRDTQKIFSLADENANQIQIQNCFNTEKNQTSVIEPFKLIALCRETSLVIYDYQKQEILMEINDLLQCNTQQMLMQDMEFQPLKEEIKTLCEQDEFFQDVRISGQSLDGSFQQLIWVLSDKCLYALVKGTCIAKTPLKNGIGLEVKQTQKEGGQTVVVVQFGVNKECKEFKLTAKYNQDQRFTYSLI